MIDKNKILENIQKNIALCNFEKELNANIDYKKYTSKKQWKIYDMKKKILALTGCSIILIGGIAYAYSSHFKLSNNFLQRDSYYLDQMPESIKYITR